MGKHRAISHSLRARTVIGGVLASGALLAVGAPAGTAFATPANNQVVAHHQEIDKRIIGGIMNSGVGKAVQAHLNKQIQNGNTRDLKFALALNHLLQTAP